MQMSPLLTLILFAVGIASASSATEAPPPPPPPPPQAQPPPPSHPHHYQCYAPAYHYGPISWSHDYFHGNEIGYTVYPSGHGYTRICCLARGCGPPHTTGDFHPFHHCTHLRMYNIGCSYGSIVAILPWGHLWGRPALQCRAEPHDTHVTWSHTS